MFLISYLLVKIEIRLFLKLWTNLVFYL